MDFSDSMYAIVQEAFPNASIVIDCFHMVKRLCGGLDEMRMRFKRKAVTETKKEEREFKKKKADRAKARAYYRKKHPRKRGEKRGRPRLRSNEKFKPHVLSNGDTKVELLTRARYILPKSGDKWSENQKKRAKLLFELQPKLEKAYSLVCQLRCIFKNRKLTKTQAKEKLEDERVQGRTQRSNGFAILLVSLQSDIWLDRCNSHPRTIAHEPKKLISFAFCVLQNPQPLRAEL